MSELFLFPFEMIEKNHKIVLYGAGNVGREFYYQVKSSRYCDIILWTDKNYKQYMELGFPVDDIDLLLELDYDYLVIAVKSREVSIQIYQELVEKFLVKKEIIIWNEYVRLDEIPDYASFIRKKNDDEIYLKQIEPKILISSDSMEHVVRYMLCRDIVNGIINNNHLSLYQRMIMTSTAANERLIGTTKAFSNYTSKQGLENYVISLNELIASMEKEGFLKSHYIPIGKNGYLANGKHRYAAALSLEKKIWVRTYENIDGHYKNINWFRQNGFSEKDILTILQVFCELYDNCGLYLIYGPVMELWGYITTLIEKKFKVAGYADLDFKDNYVGFSNLIRDNYYDDEKNLANIEQKIHYLLLSHLKVRVLVVTAEKSIYQNNTEFFKDMRKLKEEIRYHLFADAPRHTVIIHSSDGREEFEHMKGIWLSFNNIRYAGLRVLNNYGKMFVILLGKLKEYLKKKKIPIQEVCILGSAGMELYGLKCADDIDFCVSTKYRCLIKESELPDDIHLKKINSVEVEGGNIYSDDILIHDSDLHFVYDDFKFVNLEILYGFKKYRKLDKDKEDMRKLEVFFDSVKAFEGTQLFKNQVEREIGRTW